MNESAAKWRLDRSDKSKREWHASIERFHAALEAAYPPNFWTDVEKLRAGDSGGLEAAVEFLEADPMFFRSGYVKAELLGLLKRFPLTEGQVERLRDVVVRVVLDRDGREFRRYCRLAPCIDAPEIRRRLGNISFPSDPNAVRRAQWMLDALIHADFTRRGRTDR